MHILITYSEMPIGYTINAREKVAYIRALTLSRILTTSTWVSDWTEGRIDEGITEQRIWRWCKIILAAESWETIDGTVNTIVVI